MTDRLEDLLDNFPGEANRTRCFLHVVVLVAGTLKKQFDLPKNSSVDQELQKLAENIDEEEADTRAHQETDEDDDNMEGWVDELAAMDEEDRAEHETSLRPLRILLAKVKLLRDHIVSAA
jgi:hypothetical protein